MLKRQTVPMKNPFGKSESKSADRTAKPSKPSGKAKRHNERSALYAPTAFTTQHMKKRSRVALWLFIGLLAFLTWRSLTGAGSGDQLAVNELPSRVSAGAELHAANFLDCVPSDLPVRRNVEGLLNIIFTSPSAAVPEVPEGQTGEGESVEESPVEQAVGEDGEAITGIGCTSYDIASISLRRWRPVGGEGLQQHTFLATAGSGEILEVDVLIDADLIGRNPVLAAVPSVRVITPTADEVEISGFQIDGVPGAFSETAASDRLQEWAEAFLTGDQTNMLNFTDQRTSLVVPLSARSELQSVLLMEPIGQDFGTDTVRVRYVFADTSGRVHSFDVFMDRIDDPQPSIAAWGPPGASAELTLELFR